MPVFRLYYIMRIFKGLAIIILIYFVSSNLGNFNAMKNKNCSEEISGLKTCIQLKNRKIELNKDFKVNLIFKNNSEHPIRIYLINAEFFRSFQSYFYLLFNGKAKFISNISPPHGYVVTENDFHLINSKSEMIFEQILSIDDADIENDLSDIYLEWTYTNKISKWEGNIKTLDGPTKELFDGKEIPYIWQGKVESKITVKIIR